MKEEFKIRDIAAILGLEVLKAQGRNTLCVCPFCGDNRGKFAFREDKNLYNCFHCNEKGNAFSLYKKIRGISDSKEAAKEIYKELGEGIPNLEVKEYHKVEQVDKKPNEYLNKVYKTMLSMLELNPEHKADLIRRGLTEAQIKWYGFKSVPKDKIGLCKKLLKKGFNLEGVPGFYYNSKYNSWNISAQSGYFCPVYNNRDIIGFQIRVDNPKDGAKYLWFSSLNCSSGGLVTSLKGKNEEITIITEGILKASIVYALLKGNVTVVGVPGIKVINGLKPMLKGYNGFCYEAYDMDKAIKSNDEKEMKKSQNILKASNELIEILENMDIPTSSLSWDFDKKAYWNGNHKGLDDFLLALGEEKVINKFLPYIEEKASKKLKLKNFLKEKSI